MATQPTVIRTHTNHSTLVLLGLAILCTTLLAGSLMRNGVPTAAPIAAPAARTERPVTHRIFADEIAGAGALDLTGAASAIQPEWNQAQPQARTPIFVALHATRSASRIFADEIGAANAQYRDPAQITGPLPERLQDARRTATLTTVALPERVRVNNRFFADEIAAGTDSTAWSTIDIPASMPQHGPR